VAYSQIIAAPISGDAAITSSFGVRNHPVLQSKRHHSGIDIRAKEGTEVLSIGAGKVVFAGVYGSYGNLVSIEHGEEFTTLYGHLSEIKVRVGEKLKSGHLIGYSGSTGRVSGPHLHFEIRYKGKSLNPQDIINGLFGGAKG